MAKSRIQKSRAVPLVHCMRCGRSTLQVRGDWNVVYRHGYQVGYLCPDDQTAEENAEAEINLATGAHLGKVLQPGDPEYEKETRKVQGEHIVKVADDVWRDWLSMVAALPDGEAVRFEPEALADQTLLRLADTIGRPEDTTETHAYLASMFEDWAGEARGGRDRSED